MLESAIAPTPSLTLCSIGSSHRLTSAGSEQSRYSCGSVTDVHYFVDIADRLSEDRSTSPDYQSRMHLGHHGTTQPPPRRTYRQPVTFSSASPSDEIIPQLCPDYFSRILAANM